MLIVRICEYAAVHPDGTFLVIGGGLVRWRAERLPAALPLWVFIEVPPGDIPVGRHPLHLKLRGPDGLVYAAEDVIEVRSEALASARAAQLGATLHAAGRHVLDVSCGGERGRATIEIEREPGATIVLSRLQGALERMKARGGRGPSPDGFRILGEDELVRFLAKQYGVPCIDLAEFELSAEAIALVPADLARAHRLLPINRTGSTLIVAMADPSDIYAIDALKFETGLNIEVVVASEESVAAALERYYG